MIKKAKPMRWGWENCEGNRSVHTVSFFHFKDIIAERESIADELERIADKRERRGEVYVDMRRLIKELRNGKP